MSTLRRIPQRQPLSLAAQQFTLRSIFSQGTILQCCNAITWEGLLMPHEGSRDYRVRMDYTLGLHPTVVVLTPNLRALAGERRLPHCYDQATQKLCLYDPRERKWTPHLALASTVMKWTLAWLAFFEIWLATDVWYGRGTGHPGDDSSIHTTYPAQ